MRLKALSRDYPWDCAGLNGYTIGGGGKKRLRTNEKKNDDNFVLAQNICELKRREKKGIKPTKRESHSASRR